MSVRIVGVGELQILGYPRNLSEYKDWEIREARLLLRDGKSKGHSSKGMEGTRG
ncbi:MULTISPECIES: hypothetical protein [Sulfolobaceae]|uniref:hypothetical protein n=1 Tax=Sulfolobaceae TaxID=118883 RepID=UPI001E5CFE4D|nr:MULTISPECIES: hypothetical protein [unclassified Sulfolobus]